MDNQGYNHDMVNMTNNNRSKELEVSYILWSFCLLFLSFCLTVLCQLFLNILVTCFLVLGSWSYCTLYIL